MTIKASSYPTSRPTLDLNFAQTKRLDPRVTFTRSSTGTYFDANGVLQSAATNTARFDHNPATGESLGLLVEEARTNGIVYSNNFNQTSSWTISQAIPTFNASVAPDGTITATRLTTANTASTQYITSAGTNTVGPGARTASVYVKPGTCTQVQLQFNGNINTRICFNLATDSTFNVQADGSNGVGTITNVGNGWKKLTLSSTLAATDTVAIYLLQNQGFQLSAGLTLEIWGFQVEAGSFPTSYIPTPATFTSRASSATYYDASGVIQTAGTNVARSAAFFPDSNGVMRPAGLLLEAASTNELTQSQTFSTWTLGNTSITTNATTSPDGTNNASKLVENNTTNIHRISLSINPTGTYTLSVFAKAAERSILTLMPASTAGGDTPVYFDLAAGTISASLGSANSASIQKFPNGWYRCSVTDVMGGFGYPFIGVAAASGTDSYAGNGTSGIFIWGAQLEASPYPTSYIATTTATVTRSADVSSSATVTRSADVASITGTNFSSWYNQSEGTLFANALSRGSTGANFLAALNLTSAGGSTFADVLEQSTSIRLSVFNNPTTIYSATPSTSGVVAGSTRKAALALKSGNYGAALNGSASASGASATVPPSFDRLLIMNYPGFGTANGTIARLTYWPTRLSDATLQAITL